jgi:predicted dehydrogenase
MEALQIGILGLASIAKKAILPAISESKYFNLHGIATRSKEKRALIESDYDCKAYSSYNDLIKDSKVDAVYIPLPNALHFKWAKLALENKKHLLVEKSLACNFSEVKLLNDLAQERSLAIVENFQFRKHSQLERIKSIIKNKELGEIRSIRSSFGFPPFPDKNNIRYIKDLGGGALLDAGAYPIKIAQELLGLDLQVTSALLDYENTDVDIWGAGMIQQANTSNFVQFSFGFDHHYQCSLEIWGSKAKLFTNRIFTAPPGYEAVFTVESKEGLDTIIIPAENHYLNMLQYFYDCTKNKNLRLQEYKANINQARLIEEFYYIAHLNRL